MKVETWAGIPVQAFLGSLNLDKSLNHSKAQFSFVKMGMVIISILRCYCGD